MIRRALHLVVLFLSLALPVSLGAASPAHAITASCSEFTSAVVSLHNPSSGTRLLTQWDDEKASARSYGFTDDEGVVFEAASAAGTDLVGVWRLYHPTAYDFTWASEGADLDQALAAGYQKQFREFFAGGVDNGCLDPVYRLMKAGKSRLAVGTTSRDSLVAAGWSAARLAFFAQPASATFTLAVVPDTQQETWTDTDVRMRNRAQWIADNASAKGIRFVAHVGDVVDWGAVAPEQFTRARNGMAPLAGKVPWAAAIGNHDTAAVCTGGSACPGANTNVTVRDTKAFNGAFPASSFTDLAGQFEAGKIDNSFHTFTAAGQQWLVLVLELWPRVEAVTWARSVVAGHPKHNVIITTHAYLNSDGSIGTSNGGYGATSPRYLYDNLVKLYPNITMVLSGHVGGGASRIDTGVNGNKIVSLLQTYHSRTTNPTRLISIDVAKGAITHSVYAPYTKQTLQGDAVVTGLDFTR